MFGGKELYSVGVSTIGIPSNPREITVSESCFFFVRVRITDGFSKRRLPSLLWFSAVKVWSGLYPSIFYDS